MEAVKKRWRSVFDKIAVKRPDLLPLSAGAEVSGRRGPQKRHMVLAYIREHPEELRPTEDID
jgi:hypothetical protein